ncbi:MAG: hypothetical protein WCZ20_04040, partial [Hydrogenophaga sp.]
MTVDDGALAGHGISPAPHLPMAICTHDPRANRSALQTPAEPTGSHQANPIAAALKAAMGSAVLGTALSLSAPSMALAQNVVCVTNPPGSSSGTGVTGNGNFACGNSAGNSVSGFNNNAVGRSSGNDVTGDRNSASGV